MGFQFNSLNFGNVYEIQFNSLIVGSELTHGPLNVFDVRINPLISPLTMRC